MRHLLNRLLMPKKAAGIHIRMTSEEGIEGYCTIIDNRDLSVIHTEDFGSINDLQGKMPGGIPVGIVLDGNGIVHRTTNKETGTGFLQTLFPGASAEEFLVQTLPAEGNELDLTVVRRDKAEIIISKLVESGIKPVYCGLGPAIIQPYIDHNRYEEWILPHWKVTVDGKKIKSVTAQDGFVQGEIRLMKHTVSSGYALSYAAALSASHKYTDTVHPDWDYVEKLAADERFRSKLRNIGILFLIGVFTLLLGNFFILQNLGEKESLYTAELDKNKTILDQLDSTRAMLDRREQFINQSGLLEQSLFSFYADRIAFLIPSGITLTQLAFQPPVGKPRQDQVISFNQKACIVSGTVNSGMLFDNWVASLKKERWVKTVNILDYHQDEASAPAIFSLHVEIK